MAERRLRLLCLDGGGVRGLASLYMLRKLLAQVGSPKPCHFFDMIGGTSTGGLIAIMLGRLEMNIDDCIDAFTLMMDEIFQRKHRLPFTGSGNVRGRYSSDTLEKCIKKVITDAGFRADANMRETKQSTCKVFVVAMTGEARSIVRFTDYKKKFGGDDSIVDDVKIWEAARATSAATSFFEPMPITRKNMTRVFLDGGLGSNNPVDDLWQEAADEWGPDALEPQIRCLLSIGTGKPRLGVFGKSLKEVGETIIKIATETQATADRFERYNEGLFNESHAFRFNPPDIDDIGMEDAKKKAEIAVRTESYGNDADTRRKLLLFKGAAGEEQILETEPQILSRRSVTYKSYPFNWLTMGKNHVQLNATSYWRHLTLTSHEIYEKIYQNCKDHKGRVSFQDFMHQFPPMQSKPHISTVEAVWSRLLSDKSNVRNSVHPKGFAMATLYMLHIETFLPVSPEDDNKGVGVSKGRRELLKRFGNWVHCRCDADCGLEWNFANDIGMHKGGKGKKCKMEKLFTGLSFKDFSVDKELEFLRLTKQDWKNSQAR